MTRLCNRSLARVRPGYVARATIISSANTPVRGRLLTNIAIAAASRNSDIGPAEDGRQWVLNCADRGVDGHALTLKLALPTIKGSV